MKKVKSVKNPMIRAMYPYVSNSALTETLTAYAINGEVFDRDTYDIEVIVTKRVKPIADGTILHFKNWPYHIYIKNNGTWRYGDARSSNLTWIESAYTDEYVRDAEANGEAVLLNEVKA